MGKYKVQVYSMLHPVENRLVFSGAILELEKETALPYVGTGYLYPEQEESDVNTVGRPKTKAELKAEAKEKAEAEAKEKAEAEAKEQSDDSQSEILVAMVNQASGNVE